MSAWLMGPSENATPSHNRQQAGCGNHTSRRGTGALKCLGSLVAGALLLAPLAAHRPSEAQAPVNYRYFPTASITDSRMLSLGGTPVNTLAGATINIRLVVPAGAPSFELGLFDGDTGRSATGALNPGAGHWDFGTSQLIYSLYADPTGDPSVATSTLSLLSRWTGNDANAVSTARYTASGATMPDNAWWSALVSTAGTPTAADGSYIYRLVVHLQDPTSQTVSNFKLRATAGLALFPGGFSTEAAARQIINDGRIVYPTWDGVMPGDGSNFFTTAQTTYNGTWNHFLEVPAGLTRLTLWDGDFDYGTGILTGRPSGIALEDVKDTNDPDTPNAIPAFASGTAAFAEAAQGPGQPPDDNHMDFFRRSPSVQYELVDPTGRVYRNSNPSGNQEWESFVISGDPAATRATADYAPNVAADGATFVTPGTLPAGVWTVRITGLDLANIVYFQFPTFVLGEDEGGAPPSEVPPGEEHGPGKCCKVTGGGWIPLANGGKGGGKGTFGVHAMCSKKDGYKGNLEYQDHVRKLNIKSTSITRMVCEGTRVTIYGTATINGKGSFDFVVVVDDLGEPGSRDQFGIRLSNGYAAGSSVMGGGNIQVHK